MKTRINIGISGKRNISIDLDILLRTRLLIQANSGGGKSWLLRRIAEQCFGKIQVIIIDPEGEFATLREKYGYVLVGKGGETPADVRSAGLVAHKLLELHASAVCDLYEMKASQRHAWVRVFLDAMVDAPKKLWRPVLVIVDEAHTFAPEKGFGESEASDSMIGLSTKGRKRGFCACFATQRLGKFRKDAAAECLNVLVGQTFIDVDRKRAAESLGIPRGKEERAFFDEMKVMDPGNFWALGRAISKERILVKVGEVTTTHPEPGSSKYSVEPPPPPAKIKSLLLRLSDLPKEAEQKAKTEAELRMENAALKRQLAARPTVPAPVAGKVEIKEVPVITDKQFVQLQKAADKVAVVLKGSSTIHEAVKALGAISSEISTTARMKSIIKNELSLVKQGFQAPPASRPPIPSRAPLKTPKTYSHVSIGYLPGGERKILIALAQYPDGRTKVQVAILTGYAHGGGGFINYLGSLRSKGYIAGGNDRLRITEAGAAALGGFTPLPTGAELLEHWRRKLAKAERAALDVLVSVYPESLPSETVAERAGYAPGTGGINNAFSRLRTLELIQGYSELKASDTLFD